MNSYSSLTLHPPAEMEEAFSGAESPLAGWLCLAGILLHMLFSGPVLDTIGIDYSGPGGSFYEKIHPGSYLVFLSLIVLLARHGDPIRESYAVWRRYTVYASVFILFAVLLGYMAAISGPAGLAFYIDTHLTVPAAAIVLCHTPASYCRRAVYGFIAIAMVNGCMGVIETIGKFRFIAFRPDWNVIREEFFRASALEGHPLSNAMFTTVALFVMLGARLQPAIKLPLAIFFLAALVAFGGRVALAVSVVGLLLLGLATIAGSFLGRAMTLQQLLVLLAAAIAIPICLLGGMLLLIYGSPLGERLSAVGWWDISAQTRPLAFMALGYMKNYELLFGVSTDRILDIASRMSLDMPIAYIENPWLLMFMHLGIFAFPFWLGATLMLARQLMKGRIMSLKLAVLSYFLVASGSNSFGRKELVYLIMASMVICASRWPADAKEH